MGVDRRSASAAHPVRHGRDDAGGRHRAEGAVSIRRSTAVSLASAVLQMAVTLVTVPIYLRVIGFERYGVIVVVWLLSDYFVLFNIGLDRGVTNMVARFGR